MLVLFQKKGNLRRQRKHLNKNKKELIEKENLLKLKKIEEVIEIFDISIIFYPPPTKPDF